MDFSVWLALVAGLLMIGVTSSELGKRVKFRRRSRRAKAVVVGLDRSVGGHGGSMPQYRYHPILEFTTPEGRGVRARTNVGSDPPPAREGQRVTAVYDPNDPTRVEIEGKGWMELGLIFLFMLFGIFLEIVVAMNFIS